MNAMFDAIVVGSGLTGGWAAKELTERGLKTLVIERGDDLSPNMGLCRDARDPVELKKLYEEEYFIQGRNYMFGDQTRHLFNNDRLNPYVQDPEMPFNWFRVHALGGKSLLWAGGAYRWSDLDFGANAADGHGIDWPIRYGDLEKWYAHVERFVGVSGLREAYPGLEEGELLPAMPFTQVERAFRQSIRANFDDRILTMGRTAVLTEEHLGRASYDSYPDGTPAFLTQSLFTSRTSTLPAARRTGNLTVRLNSIVEKLIYDKCARRVSGVQVIDQGSRRRELITSKMVFLCASTIATTQILLQSRSEAFPRGLANSSGVLGRYLMDHFGLVCARGWRVDLPFRGSPDDNANRPAVVYVPRFRNLVGRQSHEFARGYGYIGWESQTEGGVPGLGEGRSVRVSGATAFTLQGFGECLPYAHNCVGLHETEVDRFGQPLLRIKFAFGRNERRMAEDMVNEACRMLGIAGFDPIRRIEGELSSGGDCIHEMGTARMGHDPRNSVLNARNQCHDVRNVFVTDGACMTSSSNIHPSLTYMALTARACEYAAALLKGSVI